MRLVRRSMHVIAAVAVAACATLGGAGCAALEPGVTRLDRGVPREGRYVSPEAYEHGVRGGLLAAAGEHRAAIVELRRAERDDPRSAELPARIGESACAIGDRPDAEAAFARSLANDPRFARAFVGRARCALSAHPPAVESAAADLARAEAIAPDAADTRRLAIDVARARGDRALARTVAEEAVRLHPHDAELGLSLVELAADQGDVERALEMALRVRSFDERLGAQATAKASAAAARSGWVGAFLRLSRSAATDDHTRARDALPAPPARSPNDPACDAFDARWSAVSIAFERAELAALGEAMSARCPSFGERWLLESFSARWRPADAAAIEAEARATTLPALGRWANAMALRSLDDRALAANERRPVLEGGLSAALDLARRASAVATSDPRLAAAYAAMARTAAPVDASVARLAYLALRAANDPGAETARAHLCALARTTVERAHCTPR